MRREEILSATVEHVQSVGIHALRVSDVADALNVSPALVIYHFRTKENLVTEAFRHAAERDLLRMERIIAGPAPVVDRLMESLRWYAPSGKARGWVLWIDGWSTAIRDESLARAIGELDEQWRRSIGDLIAEGVAAGDFTTEDPMAAAIRITALLDGLAVRSFVHKGGIDRDIVGSWLVRQVEWELGITPGHLAGAAG